MLVDVDDQRALDLVGAIRGGALLGLRRCLGALSGSLESVATIGIAGPNGEVRSLLHVATDWPGHFPRVAETIAVLVDAGASVDAAFVGGHAERPLHWAASSDDIAALDALLDAGADIEAPGSVIDGTTPLMDAVAFAQWRAARRLVERGAAVTAWQAAALGLSGPVETFLGGAIAPTRDDLGSLLWAACHGGQLDVVQRLVAAGAAVGWAAPWDGSTPLAAARRAGAADVVAWLEEQPG